MPASRIAPLDQVGWLAQEAEDFREWVAQAGHWRTFETGQLIYSFGEPLGRRLWSGLGQS